MNVIALKTLKLFWVIHPQAQGPLTNWYDVAKRAEWRSPQDVRNDFNSVDFVADNRAIFNIGGNKYRLITRISYEYMHVLVKFIGTHADYERIDPDTV
jgi:mRNA interferase HigB